MFLSNTLLSAALGAVPLVTFDGSDGTTFTFRQLNDPVMGGESYGSWTQSDDESTFEYGRMEGEVVEIPSLEAPGFIKAAADGDFADASSAYGGYLVLTVRSSTYDYTGYRASFASGTLSPSYACAGGGQIPYSRGCFKAPFSVPSSEGEFVDVQIPFTSFSDLWSPSTGEILTECSEDSSACVTASTLQNIRRVEIWGEGVNGAIQIDLKAVTAVPSSTSRLFATPILSSQPPDEYNKCKMPVQESLRFGISGRDTYFGRAPVDENESLAEAICCDTRASGFAEPQFLYQATDIALFDKLPVECGQKTVVFYDSSCGLPLFKAPIGRTWSEFREEVEREGWPSFREDEIISKNVQTDKDTGLVYSICGTHLGSYLPDTDGTPRWCIDLACIAGNPWRKNREWWSQAE